MAIRGANHFESVTVTHTTAIGITGPTSGTKPHAAVITVEAAAIRFRIDGTDPTATVGHEVEDGGGIELADRGEISLFKAIRRDGVDATLRVTLGVEYVP